jgi:hypothetical protein
MCNSTLRRPLPRICGTADRLHSWVDLNFGAFGERLRSPGNQGKKRQIACKATSLRTIHHETKQFSFSRVKKQQ